MVAITGTFLEYRLKKNWEKVTKAKIAVGIRRRDAVIAIPAGASRGKPPGGWAESPSRTG